MSYPDQIGIGTAFLVGMCGAFVIYFIRFKQTRFEQALSDLQNKWPQLLCDLFPFIICGGFIACFLICATSIREAFLAGLAWEGIIFGVIEGAKLSAKA